MLLDLENSSKGHGRNDLQSPSPISELETVPAMLQLLTEVLPSTMTTKKIHQAIQAETRTGIDDFLSLQNSGQKIDLTKMPKLCITQSINRSPNTFQNLEFYKSVVKDTRTHLATAVPFPAYALVVTQFLPVVEFRYLMFKFV